MSMRWYSVSVLSNFEKRVAETIREAVVQNSIQDKLGLNVLIQNKKNNSGKITILYKNLEQFQLISDLLKRN